MSAYNVMAEATTPSFYNRVGFIALKVAQYVASEDPATANHSNRLGYANRIFTGREDNIQLSQHVVSSNPTIYSTLETQGGSAVPDGDIEYALSAIWDARANAFLGTAPAA